MTLILENLTLPDTLNTAFYLDSQKNYLELSDLDLARTYERLGTIYFTKCMYDLAMENFIQAQTILSKAPDTFQGEIARIHNNIGTVLHKRSEYNEAIASFKKSMDLLLTNNEGKGKEKELAACQENLGFELSVKGNFQDSLYNLKKAYILKKHVYGEKHPLVADNFTKMGSLFNKMGKYSKALEYLDRAINMKYECQSNSTETINIHEELAKVYINQVEWVQASDSITKAYNIKQENFEPKHFLFAKTYVLQGNLHRIQGQYKEAIDSFKQALEIQKKKVNSLHPEIGDTYYQLGHAYAEDGQFKEAADCYSKSLKSFEMNYGGENPRTKKAKERMEKCLVYTKKNEENIRKMSQSETSQGEKRKESEITSFVCPHSNSKGSITRKGSIIRNACTICGIGC